MKKSLIALAVLSTIAGSAAAQSSVSVYGRLDAGYRDHTSTATTGVQTQSSAVGYSAFTSSRLGFMGTEDLGGGVKAGFTVEGGIAAAPGTTGSNNATAFNLGRQQFLTLSSNNGTLLAGKTDALVKTVFDNFDAGFSNNLAGAYDNMGAAVVGGGSGTNIIGNRRDAVVRYTSPKFSNVDVSVGILKTTTEVDGKDSKTEDNSGYEAGLRYAAGPLSVAAAYRTADVNSPSAAGTAGSCITTATGVVTTSQAATVNCAATTGVVRFTGTDPVARVEGTTDSIALGASYNFGPVVAFAQYFDQEAKNKVDNTKVDEDAIALGVRVPMGKATLFASYTDGESTSATNVKTNFDGMQFGVKYDLSKRTYGYVAYGEKDEQATGANKTKVKDLALGIAHHF